MSTRARLLVAFVLTACAPAPCPADPVMDAGRPAEAPDAAPRSLEWDAGLGCVGAPSTLAFAPVATVSSPSDTSVYAMADPRPVHIEIYAHGGTTPLAMYDGAGWPALDLGPTVTGDYDVAMVIDGYAVGMARMNPAMCPEHATSPQPWCPPLRVVVSRCDHHGHPVALFCVPGMRACPTDVWR